MKFAIQNKTDIIKMYVDEKLNATDIAKKYNTDPNKILRALKYLKIEIRSKSEIQSELLSSGKVTHPTKGKTLTDETKEKISRSSHEKWLEKSDEEKERFRQEKKLAWQNRTDAEKNNFESKSVAAIIKAAREGSKAEKKIMEMLQEAGYNPLHHHKPLAKEKLEVDILLPDNRVAIEIDGLSHYSPIWGDANFSRVVKADTEKNGILILNGFCVIRIKNTVNTVTQFMYTETCKTLIDILKSIEIKFPDMDKRIIHVDIENGEII